MGRVHVRSLMRSRSQSLLGAGDGIELDVWEDGAWGLITIWEGGLLSGFEFLETQDSWTRDDATLQYREAASDGFSVTVLVPGEVLDEVRGLAASPSVRILSYERVGLMPHQMA